MKGVNKLRRPRIYLETTIFNHYFDTDREAHAATVKLFDEIKAGLYEAYTSAYVLEELEKAQEPKKSNMLALISGNGITILDDKEEIRRLGDMYVDESVIPAKYRYDGLHIACATVYGLDYVFSLNFKHINKLKTKTMTSNINIRTGYHPVTILSPLEVVSDDE